MNANFWIILAVLCVAGCFQGMTGFGFGLLTMSLLPWILGLKSASFLVAIFNLLVTGITLYANHRHFRWSLGRGLIIGSCCGVPLGVYLLATLSQRLLQHLLGGGLILFAVYDLTVLLRRSKRKDAVAAVGDGDRRPSSLLSFPVGMLSGSLGGAFNIGGPPAVLYVYAQPWSKEEAVATLQVTFAISAVMRILLIGMTPIASVTLLRMAVWDIVPVAGAILIGTRLCSWIPQVRLRKGVIVFLGIVGAKYLFFS